MVERDNERRGTGGEVSLVVLFVVCSSLQVAMVARMTWKFSKTSALASDRLKPIGTETLTVAFVQYVLDFQHFDWLNAAAHSHCAKHVMQ